nr:MAG TPA: hypothetical protein [Bacteriophage sp.]
MNFPDLLIDLLMLDLLKVSLIRRREATVFCSNNLLSSFSKSTAKISYFPYNFRLLLQKILIHDSTLKF